MQRNGSTPYAPRQASTLLVAGDNTRETLELALSIRGLAVTSCGSTSAARETLALSQAFTYVLLSHELPDVERLAFCRDLRSSPATERAVIIVLVADDVERQLAIDAGASDCLAWPTDIDAVYESIIAAGKRLSTTTPARSATSPGVDRDWLFVMDASGTITRAGDSIEPLLGFPSGALTGINAFTFFHPDDAPTLLSILTEALAGGNESRTVELRLRRQGDTWRNVSLSVSNCVQDSDVRGICFNLRGADARVQVSDQTLRSTMHDRVTDLPNRSLFIDRVDHAVARANRRQQPVVVMAVDFNGYAPRGDTQPVDVSDGIVIALAQRLRACLRTSDTAARLGHDEFALLLEEIVDPENVKIVADRIVQSMTVPFIEGTQEIELVPNIGIVVSTPERNRAVDLLQNANVARSWARVQGSGRYVMFDPSMGSPEFDALGTAAVTPIVAPAQPASATPVSDERYLELHERLAAIEASITSLTRLVVERERVSLPT
jgi:diguanylate cyclase (GGDEF)-like protein/PAS domain S-box-containing protein